MGYGDGVGEEGVEKEVGGVVGGVEGVSCGGFCFLIWGGELDEWKEWVCVGDRCLSIGKIMRGELGGI